MPEELKRALAALTVRYDKFTHKVLWGLVIGWISCVLITGGLTKFLYDRIQNSREDAIVESCLDDTGQSQQNIVLLQTLGVPDRIVTIARNTYPIHSRTECEKIAKDRIS